MANNVISSDSEDEELTQTQRQQHAEEDEVSLSGRNDEEDDADGLAGTQADGDTVNGIAVNGVTARGGQRRVDRRTMADWEVTDEDWGPVSDEDFLARERQRLARYKIMLETRRRRMDEEYESFERDRATLREDNGPRGRKRPHGPRHPMSPSVSMSGASDYAESFLNGGEDSVFDSVSTVHEKEDGPTPAKKGKMEDKTAGTPKAVAVAASVPAPAAAGEVAAAAVPAAGEAPAEVEPDPFEHWDNSPFAAAAQQAVQEAQHENVSEQVTPGMAKVLQTLFKNSKDLTKAQELVDKYPPPKNAKQMLAPKMDAGFYRSDRVDYATKRADKELQLSQACILSGIVAVIPMLELMVQRGNSDEQLAAAGTSTLDALRLAFYANTSVTRRRRQALRPTLDARVARSVVEAEVSGESLFGDDVENTVKEAKKADKLVQDLMGPDRGRGRGRGTQRGRGQPQGQQRGRGRGSNNQYHSHDPNYRSHAQRGGFREPQAPPRGSGGRGGRGVGRGGRREQDDTTHHSPLDRSNNGRGGASRK